MQNENVFFTTDKYNNLTDEEIISQIKQGDESALVYLLEKYKDIVNFNNYYSNYNRFYRNIHSCIYFY